MILKCPHCENEFYVRDELAGETVNCHKCKRPVQAPEKPAPRSDNEGTIVTSFDLGLRSKPEAETEAVTKERNDSKSKLTFRRGFRRLALLLSVMLGPIAFFAIEGAGGFTINDYLLLIRSSFPFLENANETLRAGVEFVAICLGGFIVVWALYLLASFIVQGFLDSVSDKPEKSG